jgi:hypothetical protein
VIAPRQPEGDDDRHDKWQRCNRYEVAKQHQHSITPCISRLCRFLSRILESSLELVPDFA